MKVNNGWVVFALGIALLGSSSVAQAEACKGEEDSMVYSCGTAMGRDTQVATYNYAHRYLMRSLAAVEAGRGTQQVALINQTEPEEMDSVFNWNENPYRDSEDEAIPEDDKILNQKDNTLYETNAVKNDHDTFHHVFFSSMNSGVTLPDIVDHDNIFGVNFKAETKKDHAPSKYGISFGYSRKLSDDLQLSLGWSALSWNSKHAGCDNGSVALTYNILKNKWNALSMRANVDFPTGSTRFSTVGLEPTLEFSYAYYLPEQWSLVANLGVQNCNDIHHGPSYARINYGFQVGKAIDDENYLALNFTGKNRDACVDGVSTNALELFYNHKFNSEHAMSFNLKKGLSYNGTDWKFGLGYTYSF